MRLKKSQPAANEELLRLVNEGYRLLHELQSEFSNKLAARSFDEQAASDAAAPLLDSWMATVNQALNDIFPTEREWFIFVDPESPFQLAKAPYYHYKCFLIRLRYLVKGLDEIRTSALGQYTDLPIAARLYVEDIDSFSKVRDVNPAQVADVLREGRVELSEEQVQLAFEQILAISFHRLDWGGEINDLYTANVIINGARTATAFALKGRGCKARELTIADCGKNGDQIVRLVESPAVLFIVQYVGPVSDAVVRDIESKIEHRRSLGKPSCYCIVDGQDTARVLRAYGNLPP